MWNFEVQGGTSPLPTPMHGKSSMKTTLVLRVQTRAYVFDVLWDNWLISILQNAPVSGCVLVNSGAILLCDVNIFTNVFFNTGYLFFCYFYRPSSKCTRYYLHLGRYDPQAPPFEFNSITTTPFAFNVLQRFSKSWTARQASALVLCIGTRCLYSRETP